MRRLLHSALLVLMTCVGALSARANPVATWNEAAGMMVEADHGPSHTLRLASPNTARAQVALAVFEAVNAIDRRYRSYLGVPVADGRASQRAAIAAAAHDVLVQLFPDRAATLDDALALDLGTIPESGDKTSGIAIGRAAAKLVLARPLKSASAAVPSYRPRTNPGVYVPTDLPVLPMSAYVTTPWLLSRPDEFAPPAPPALTDARYLRDWDEVRRLGRSNSTERTTAQTVSARFWDSHDWSLMIRMLMARQNRPLVQDARFYALLAMAIDDAGTAVTVAKYDHGFWRPITAIRNAADDGVAATAAEADWTPLLRTPLHPEYPCGHCIFAAVTANIVAAEFGARPPGGLIFRNPSMPGAQRTLETTDDYIREVSDSRIFAGVHYRFSAEASVDMARRIANAVLARGLQPLEGKPGEARQ